MWEYRRGLEEVEREGIGRVGVVGLGMVTTYTTSQIKLQVMIRRHLVFTYLRKETQQLTSGRG